MEKLYELNLELFAEVNPKVSCNVVRPLQEQKKSNLTCYCYNIRKVKLTCEDPRC